MRTLLTLTLTALLAIAATLLLRAQPVRITIDAYPTSAPAPIEVIPDPDGKRLLHHHNLVHPALPGSRLRLQATARSFERRSFFLALDYHVKGTKPGIRVERFHPGDGHLRTIVIDQVLPQTLIPETVDLYLGIHNGTQPVPVTNVTAQIQSPPWPEFRSEPDALDIQIPLDQWRASPKHIRRPDSTSPAALLRLAWNGGSVLLQPTDAAAPQFYECEITALPYRLQPDQTFAPAPTHTYVALDTPNPDALTFNQPDAWLRPSWADGDILASRYPYASVRWATWSTTSPTLRFLKRPDAGLTHLQNGPQSGTLDLYTSEGEELAQTALIPTRTAERYTAQIPRSALPTLRIESNQRAILSATIHTWIPQTLYSGDAYARPRRPIITTERTPLTNASIPSRTPCEHGGPVTFLILFALLALPATAILSVFSKRRDRARNP